MIPILILWYLCFEFFVHKLSFCNSKWTATQRGSNILISGASSCRVKLLIMRSPLAIKLGVYLICMTLNERGQIMICLLLGYSKGALHKRRAAKVGFDV